MKLRELIARRRNEALKEIARIHGYDAPTTRHMNQALRAKEDLALCGNAEKIADLIEAAEWFANEYEIADEAGELGFWPGGENEISRFRAIHAAYRALADEREHTGGE